jgi:alanine racemase
MAEAIVDLKQLAQNIAVVRARVGERIKILFPVKADAYGHGAVAVAHAAERAGVDYFGVANIAEAQELREAGIKAPILILASSRIAHIAELVRTDVDITLSSVEFAQALAAEAQRQGRRVRVQVKVDTGMGAQRRAPQRCPPNLSRHSPDEVPRMHRDLLTLRVLLQRAARRPAVHPPADRCLQ